MERIEGLSIGLDLETMKVDSGLKDLKSKLTLVNSEMKANMSAFDRGDKSVGKYETRLKGLNKKLEVQKAVTENARKTYDKMVEAHGEGSKEAEKAATEYNKQAAALNNLDRYIEGTKNELAKLKEEQRIANSNWTKMGTVLDNTGSKMKAFGTGMDNTGRQLTQKVTLPLTLLGGAAVKTGIDFESGMSKVGAVSGASAKQMKVLEAKAREMGASTVFSAKEASDAFYYMSLAGWKAEDMVDGIGGTMDLAAASGEDLASVSDILTDGLTAFGLAAKDSGRMADVLAAASSNANTDVRGLGAAFKYAAPVAGALGYTIEDTSKAIGLMANAGIKGEKAGTALRTMMTNLSKPTKSMNKEMKKYGIALTDSKGNMKAFDSVMLDLRKNLGKLDKQQQASAAATIFGKEAMSGALAIINASEKDYKKLTKAIKDSEGVAGDMADTMQDNLAGSLKELRSKMEDLFITGYKNLRPTLDNLIEGAKDLTDWFAKLSPKTQENIVKFGLLAAAAGPVLSLTGKLTFGIGGLMQGMGALSKTIGVASGKGLLGRIGLMGVSSGPVGIAIGTVATLGAGIYALSKATGDSVVEVQKGIEKRREEIDSLDKTIEAYEKLRNKNELTKDEMLRYMDVLAELKEAKSDEAIKNLTTEQEDLLKKSGLTNKEMEKFLELNDYIIEKSPNVVKAVSEQGKAYADQLDELKELNRLERERLTDETYQAITEELKEQKENLAEQKELQSELDTLEKNRTKEIEKKLGFHDRIREIDLEVADLQTNKIGATSEELEIIKEKEDFLRIERQGLKNVIEDKDIIIAKTEKEIKEKQKSLEETNKELEAFDDLLADYAQMILYEQGIVSEKGKANEAILAEQKNIDTAKKKLQEMKEAGKGNTTEYQEQNDKIREQQRKLDQAREKLEEMNKVAGKTVYKDLRLRTSPTIDELERRIATDVTKRVKLHRGGQMLAYAEGTPPSGHPGGNAVLGDGKGLNAGRELVKLPGGKMFLSSDKPTLYPNLPRGTQVVPAKTTKQLLKPKRYYANGTRNWQSLFNLENANGFMKLLALLAKGLSGTNVNKKDAGPKEDKYGKELLEAVLQQNQILMQILQKEFKAEVAFESVYQPIKQRFQEDQYSQFKQRRR
ncbi:phage tail tape measure protein [Virgibacillus sp. MG-45]|uniref:phage tail tape measure protein n=1 Tax=Virgibacillus sp. MG-45 TaxID=3102791 RepID=UPI002EDB6595